MNCISLRILLIEDDPVSAAVVRRAFDVLGVRADLAESAEAALRLHAREPYRVVISNSSNTSELCRLRESGGPYVYLLAWGQPNEAFDDFLANPLDPGELRARLALAARILAVEDNMADQREREAMATHAAYELNESLRIASRRFEDLFNGLPMACFTYDATGCVHEWNQAAEEAFGIPAFDTLVRPVWEVLAHSSGAWSRDRCRAVFSGAGHEEFEWTYDGFDSPREFACRIIALRGKAGRTVGAVVANVDVTAHKRAERLLSCEKATLEDANARLHELASKDGLTGLLNRRAFIAELEKALSEFNRTGRPFSLLLLDIDKFKQYNDSFGHPAGDEVLRRFARVLRTTARSYEAPARYGGEEFAIVLHNTDSAKALIAAERFRKAVEDGDWVERAVTCSLGAATVEIGNATPDALIAAADAALYASKASGRNRSTHAAGLEGSIKAA